MNLIFQGVGELIVKGMEKGGKYCYDKYKEKEKSTPTIMQALLLHQEELDKS